MKSIKTKTQPCDATKARKRLEDARAYLETADVIGAGDSGALGGVQAALAGIRRSRRVAAIHHAKRLVSLAEDLLSA